jgi:hypothetical protein
MARRLHPTLADYLVIAVNPVLIMTLVGSLVYFLLEVFYQGGYEARLQFILSLFVMAAVLIGRISIESGSDRAVMFALPLAIVTGLAIARFTVNASLVSWALLGLIWWSTHRLTWDCTFLDESKDVSDAGLLQTIGQGRETPGTGPNAAVTPADAANGASPPAEEEAEGVTSRDQKKARWWEFWLDRRLRPNAPGVWIVYFSLAALPVFGIGQGLIPKTNAASRQYVFWLLCIYVASGLGLLMNTSFLGLRRYLRERRLQMPAAMAGVWITVGGLLIVGLLVVAMLLPRPNAGDPVSQLAWRVGSKERDPSRLGMGKEGVRRDDAQKEGSHDQTPEQQDRGQGETKGEPPKGEGKPDDQDPAPSQQGEKSGESKSPDKQGEKSGEASPREKQEGKSDPSKSQGKQGKEPGESKAEGKQGEKTGESSDQENQEEKSDRAKSQGKPEGQSQGKQEEKSDESRPKDKPRAKSGRSGTQTKPREKADQSQDKKDQEPQRSPNASRQRVSLPEFSFTSLFQWLGPVLRWLFYGVVILLVGYWLWRARAQVAAALAEWLAAWRDFWDRLLGRRRKEVGLAAVEARVQEPPRPLAAFSDPFATGEAGRMSPAELVRYTFAALEAWARENNCGRLPEETPHEFARKIGDSVPSLARETGVLADLYCRVAYAPERLSAVTARPLEQLWQTLLSTARPSGVAS